MRGRIASGVPDRAAIVRRRALSIPLVFVAFAVVTVTFPVLAGVALIVDAARGLLRRRPWMAIRALAFGWVYLVVEMVGLGLAAAVWIATLGGRLVPLRRWLAINYALQIGALRALFGAARRLFSLRFDIEGDDVVAPGPILLLMRHASIVDVLLPATLVTIPHGILLRYVLKQELLADPIFDVLGSRIPNHFVDRTGVDSATQLAAVRDLARGLTDDEGVIIYPEGTRFSAAKQARVLERLADGDPALYARAQKLRHVLPPRLGGARALLEAAPHTDVVICDHYGFDGIAEVQDFWSGAIVGRAVRVRFRRYDAATVPTTRRAQHEWLLDRWTELDGWIDAQVTA